MKNAATLCRTEAKQFVKEGLFWIGLLIKSNETEDIETIFKAIVVTTKVYHQISKHEIVYLYATGSIMQHTGKSNFDPT